MAQHRYCIVEEESWEANNIGKLPYIGQQLRSTISHYSSKKLRTEWIRKYNFFAFFVSYVNQTYNNN